MDENLINPSSITFWRRQKLILTPALLVLQHPQHIPSQNNRYHIASGIRQARLKWFVIKRISPPRVEREAQPLDEDPAVMMMVVMVLRAQLSKPHVGISAIAILNAVPERNS